MGLSFAVRLFFSPLVNNESVMISKQPLQLCNGVFILFYFLLIQYMYPWLSLSHCYLMNNVQQLNRYCTAEQILFQLCSATC